MVKRKQKNVQLVDNVTHVVTTAAAAFGHGSSSSYFLWVDSQVGNSFKKFILAFFNVIHKLEAEKLWSIHS